MTANIAPERFTSLPDEMALASTVAGLEEHGFSVEVVDDLDAARQATLSRIPDGATVMTNTSVTLQETGIDDAINGGGPYTSARNKMFALDFQTQKQHMKAIGGQPDYALGSVHAITREKHPAESTSSSLGSPSATDRMALKISHGLDDVECQDDPSRRS